MNFTDAELTMHSPKHPGNGKVRTKSDLPSIANYTDKEGLQHAAGKAQIVASCPLEGVVSTEKCISDCCPDILVESPHNRDCVIQIVNKSAVYTRESTKVYLKHGYSVYFVINRYQSEMEEEVRKKLSGYLSQNHEMGTYSPYILDFDLGEPINLSNFKYILDGTFAELRPKDFDRRGRWKWDTGQSYLVGTFELTSEMFSVYSKDYAGSKFVIVYCSDDSQVEYEFEELVSWFKRNDVRRREPVTGYRSKRESPCL